MDNEESIQQFTHDKHFNVKASSAEPQKQKTAGINPKRGGFEDPEEEDLEKCDLKSSTLSNSDVSAMESDIEITFQTMLPCSGKHLKITYHEPVYELPIPTNPKYQSYSVEERLKLLESYQTKISDIQTGFARRSIFRAPYPKVISPKKASNWLAKDVEENEVTDEMLESISASNLYVSRSGRQVKRKIYTEDADVEEFDQFASAVKKNKALGSDTKIILDIPLVIKETSQKGQGTEKSSPKTGKLKRETVKRNFSASTKRSSRAEKLFDNLINGSAKLKQQEDEMDHFESTLLPIDEADEQPLDTGSAVNESLAENNEDHFVRQRVVPPIPTVKGGRQKKIQKDTTEDLDRIDVVESSPPSSPVLSSLNNRMKNSRKNLRTQKPKDDLLVEEGGLAKVDCPICGQKFPQVDIETHASSCGENNSEDLQDSQSKTITCCLCDRVFVVSAEYQVHVKQCIASNLSSM